MDLADPERALTLSYAPQAVRPALATLWRLDERLGQVVAATRDARIGEIRLAWWREALEKLDTAPPPDEPVLRDVAAELVARGLQGVVLSGVADGWSALLATPIDDEALAVHAVERGGALFAAGARLLGGAFTGLQAAGEGWALVDLACHVREPAVAASAVAQAQVELGEDAGLNDLVRVALKRAAG